MDDDWAYQLADRTADYISRCAICGEDRSNIFVVERGSWMVPCAGEGCACQVYISVGEGIDKRRADNCAATIVADVQIDLLVCRYVPVPVGAGGNEGVEYIPEQAAQNARDNSRIRWLLTKQIRHGLSKGEISIDPNDPLRALGCKGWTMEPWAYIADEGLCAHWRLRYTLPKTS